MAEIVRMTGEYEPLTLPENTDGRLEVLQGIVGGFIEIVPLRGGKLMVIDEEGKLKGKKVNREATLLYGLTTIVGDVVVVSKDEV